MSAAQGTYKGLPGAFPFAFRRATSRWFKAYVALAAILALLFGAVFALALVSVVAGTLGASPAVTLVRSFYVVVGLFVVVPLLAPVLLVARRHRREAGVPGGVETRYAVAGYGYIASLYLGLVISIPPEQQPAVTGLTAPLVEVLFAAPQIAGLLPPILGALAIAFVHRRTATGRGDAS